MRKWFIWAIVMIGCLPINKALAQQSGDAERNTLRIMSYNIRNGRGMDEVTDLGRIADAICKVAPDVVAVQEVDSVTGRSGGIDVLRTLGERTLMFPTYAPAIDFDEAYYQRFYFDPKTSVADPQHIERLGLAHLPVCIAKTQKSFTNNEALVGRPIGFDFSVREFEIAAGAGFLVPIAGAMMRLPGLPERRLPGDV